MAMALMLNFLLVMSIFHFMGMVGAMLLTSAESSHGLKRDALALQARGAVRTYDFTISRGSIAPDGFQKQALLINGQFPGPTIEANLGDTIQVTVHNQITGPEEGTTLHWHGILQHGTPYQDGVPSVTQCPIAPGKSLTYTFLADSFGTSFYHSHYSAQYIDGIFGAMVIQGPLTARYDIDLGPVLLTDYFHTGYVENVANFLKKPLVPALSDNNLINGKTDATFYFQTGRTHRLRLINAGAEALQRFSIDNHDLTVIANDFIPIVPYTTKVVSLSVGQRIDILVKATGKPTDAVWMRSNISTLCSLPPQQPFAKAAILYPRARNATPATTAQPYVEANCYNDPPIEESVPFFPTAPPEFPATTTAIDTTLGMNETGFTLFFENDSSFRGDYNTPILPLAAARNTSYPNPEWNVYNYGSNNSIRIILYNPTPLSHPMHLHGHDFWVLAAGFGVWDGGVTNAGNPSRRDTQVVAPGTAANPGYIVIEFMADNPGVWALHCHIVWHVSLGLYVNILEAPAKIPFIPQPPSVAQTCRDWAAFTAGQVVDQIDSGLR